jgi:predicted nucleotidyltransferase
MQITPYPNIEKLLSSLLYQMQRILDKNLIGLYLYGSLVTGDFDLEISDIDLLAVISFDIDDKEFEQLRSMHNDLIAKNPNWDDRIEIQYLSANALRTFKTQRTQIAVISPGEPFNIKDAGIDWLVNWYIVRKQGVTLFGPSPQTLIPPISKEEFLQASREHAKDWVEWANQPRDGKGQSYVILTMCRALYASQNGEQASKKQASLWAQEQFPQWASLIQNALVWRAAWQVEAVEYEATFPETVRFIHFAVDRIASR